MPTPARSSNVYWHDIPEGADVVFRPSPAGGTWYYDGKVVYWTGNTSLLAQMKLNRMVRETKARRAAKRLKE